MARGWESKAIESQQEAADRVRSERARSRPPTTADERARQAYRETLRLARVRVEALVAGARNDTQRAMVREALATIDRALADSDDGPVG